MLQEERANSTHSVDRLDKGNEDAIKPKPEMPGGLNFFNKLKKTTDEEAKEKLTVGPKPGVGLKKFNFE